MKDNIVLIPGITGKMGQEYSKKFSEKKDFELIGFTSKKEKTTNNILNCNFLDLENISKVLSDINLKKYKNIYLIHSIGPFLFEEQGDKTVEIDKKIFNLNYQTFVNITEELKKQIDKNQNLILCAFGSISDRLEIPFWKSYSISKNKLRKYIIDNMSKNIRGVFIDVSSTEKEEERPYADKTYWLKCSEVVDRTIDSILNNKLNFQEVFVIKPHPEYNKDYFNNLDKLKNKWMREMYGDKNC